MIASDNFMRNSFLACLWECTGRAFRVPPASALASAVAEGAVLAKCQRFAIKLLRDGQCTIRQAILYTNWSC